jgi:hypothetical protein
MLLSMNSVGYKPRPICGYMPGAIRLQCVCRLSLQVRVVLSRHIQGSGCVMWFEHSVAT